jgi:RNA 2',3'-cyclic 3'-phosphodiesterase
MRLFVAVNFDDTVRDAIQAALDDFPVANPPWRWLSSENWHVTLKFLGDTQEDDVAEVVAALEPVRARHASFHVALGKFGAFPSLRAPRVLFYGVETGWAELAALANDVDLALEAAVGSQRETRRFHSHATVARIKEPLPRSLTDALASVPPLSHPVTRVSAFDLVESRLGRTGARYSTVKRFALP